MDNKNKTCGNCFYREFEHLIDDYYCSYIASPNYNCYTRAINSCEYYKEKAVDNAKNY